MNFKSPLPLGMPNKYMFVAIDSQGSDLQFHAKIKTIIQCLGLILSLCGAPNYIHSNLSLGFTSHTKEYL